MCVCVHVFCEYISVYIYIYLCVWKWICDICTWRGMHRKCICAPFVNLSAALGSAMRTWSDVCVYVLLCPCVKWVHLRAYAHVFCVCIWIDICMWWVIRICMYVPHPWILPPRYARRYVCDLMYVRVSMCVQCTYVMWIYMRIYSHVLVCIWMDVCMYRGIFTNTVQYVSHHIVNYTCIFFHMSQILINSYLSRDSAWIACVAVDLHIYQYLWNIFINICEIYLSIFVKYIYQYLRHESAWFALSSMLYKRISTYAQHAHTYIHTTKYKHTHHTTQYEYVHLTTKYRYMHHSSWTRIPNTYTHH